MTERKARASARANTGALRVAQDDGERRVVGEVKRARTETRALVYLLMALIVRAKARTYLRDNGKDEKQIPAE
jgi:hypothetical protein